MKKLGLTSKIFIGFALGIILGLIFKEKVLILKPLGDIFLTLIKMIVVPLVFCSITSGVASIGDINRLKRIGSRTVIYFVVTTMLAGIIGLLIANFVQPGAGVDLNMIQASSKFQAKEMPTLAKTLLDMFPSNPIKSMVDGNLMQIIVFSLFLGVSLTMLGEKGKKVIDLFNSGTEAMYKMTAIVMEFSPIGVAALMACSIGEYGIKIFGPLGKFIMTDYLGLLTVIIIMYIPMLKFIAKVPLGYFFKKVLQIWMVTASTTSSSGTLPVTIGVTKKRFGVPDEIAEFILPLGATMNMNGAVVYYSAAVMFVSQIYGIHMELSQQILTIVLATIISIGSPGIPGGGIVMTIMLLTTMGLPMEIVGMIAGIYRILDMGHTTLNVTGDVVTSLCISRSEKVLNDSVYDEVETVSSSDIV
ncbi:Proton/sodium-glutamate symport protein [bioreactor metagenome]|jgi:Na+/H+-dicarboxylate symporters|uniref:Proton/sodium-glutamate symport protein n=1 Tax=bioreactor metagenome TaxID=1076179 RepID=A0A644W471_9ZZZZ|nr:dicarboxylate/amino acid:cation symporter [Acidaminococcaceae bacterium]